jgi:DNA-binding transcriptional MocR family regulator
MTTTPSFATTEPLSAPFRGLSPERVAYCRSVSKTLSPALRIGWTVLPHKWIDEVSRQKLFDDMGTTVLEQLTLACFFDAGGFNSTAAGSAQRQTDRLADEARAGATALHALFATTRRGGTFRMPGYRSHHDCMRSEDMCGTSANRGDSDDY